MKRPTRSFALAVFAGWSFATFEEFAALELFVESCFDELLARKESKLG